MITIGIDPGKHGSFAVIHDTGVASVHPFVLLGDEVDWHDFIFALRDLTKDGSNNVRAVVEKVSAMPGQGVVSMFNFGKNTGTIHGILIALDIPFLLVAPQTWKASVLRDTNKSKDAAVMHCANAWPNVSMPKTKAAREGAADALCIAEWGWLKYGKV